MSKSLLTQRISIHLIYCTPLLCWISPNHSNRIQNYEIYHFISFWTFFKCHSKNTFPNPMSFFFSSSKMFVDLSPIFMYMFTLGGKFCVWYEKELKLILACRYIIVPVPFAEESMCVISCSVVSDSCDPMHWSPPGSSIRGIFQARMLDWVALS